jgi:Phage major capsid protein E
MNTNPNYSTVTLLEAFEAGPLVHTFLRDTFFAKREYPPTSTIEFDFRRGRRQMAPFVAPLIGGKVMERMGYETRSFKAPRIAPVRALRTPDLEPRLPGQSIYSGQTEADRAAELIMEDSEFLDEAISRREEWMCREVLINGYIPVTAENGYQNVISFLEYGYGPTQTTSNHYPVAIKWDQANSDPLADLQAARLAMIRDSGIAPNVALFGTNAAAVFIRNQSVQNLLDNRRIELATIQPIIQDDAVVRFMMVGGMDCYTYSEYFQDDLGALFEMLPPDLVLLLSTNVQNKIVYGAFTQLEDAKAKRWVTYRAPRIPFAYGDEEGGALYYRLTSCPLPMPVDILAMRLIEALPGGVGPFAEKRKPFFEADYPDEETRIEARKEALQVLAKEEAERQKSFTTGDLPASVKLSEEVTGEGIEGEQERENENGDLNQHTVEELRQIAADEQIELSGADRKADIIKAIKRARKDRE